jgi:hypothetical protein
MLPFLLHNNQHSPFIVSSVLLVSQEYMEAVMKKKKPCPNCLRARWLILYFGCFAMLAILVANQFLEKGI